MAPAICGAAVTFIESMTWLLAKLACRLHLPVAEAGPLDALDSQQSDRAARNGRLVGGGAVWPWHLGQSGGGGPYGRRNRARRRRRAPGAEKTDGHGARRSGGHPRRSHDRKHVLHLFCGGRNGFAVAAGLVFCARSGDRFSAWVGAESWPLRMGSEPHAADLVGTRSGGIALEPRTLR